MPNGEILRVGNQSQNWSQTVLDIGVAYDEDLARVRRVLEDVAHDLWDDEDFKGTVIEEPSVWGVQDLAADRVAVRVVLKTTPGHQWAVAREMRQRIKARFDHEGIEIPFPQRSSGTAASRPRSDPRRPPRRRDGRWMDRVSTFYDEIGGETRSRAIVPRFYEGVADDEVLRPLYPEADLGPAEERFRLFLVQYWGGPTTYATPAGTPGCGCGTRRSRSPRRRRSTGWRTSAPASTRWT